MGIIKHPKLEALERECSENLKAALDEAEAFQFAEFDAKEVERTGYSNYSYWGSTFRAFCKNKLALALVFIVLIILAFTFLQPYLPGQFDAFAVNNDPETGIPLRNEPPNSVHWLGTNSIGQDLWSRLWQGTRTSLLIGLAVACIEAVVGITVGVLWGYVRKLDFVFTELYNILDNIPSTVVLILVSYMLRPGRGDDHPGHVHHLLDRHGALYPQPDHHHPRQGVQPGLAVPGHAGIPHHPAQPAAVPRVGGHAAHGAVDSLGHRHRRCSSPTSAWACRRRSRPWATSSTRAAPS